jgi:hypothetical protein
VKSEAIRCAIKLHAEPVLLARFDDPFRRLPRGITELLRLVSSDAALQQISKKNNLNASRLKKILLNYIESVLLQKSNSDFRKLGLEQQADRIQQKLHYKLLMNIFHPDKSNNNSSQYHDYTQLISQAYKQVKSDNTSFVSKPMPVSRFTMPLVKDNDIQLESTHELFTFDRRKISMKKAFILPSIAVFLVVLFVLFSLFVSPSPQLVVKKTIPIDSVTELRSKGIDLFDEGQQSTLLSVGEQQQLSKGNLY